MISIFIPISIMFIIAIVTFALPTGDGSDSDNDINQGKKEEKLEKYT